MLTLSPDQIKALILDTIRNTNKNSCEDDIYLYNGNLTGQPACKFLLGVDISTGNLYFNDPNSSFTWRPILATENLQQVTSNGNITTFPITIGDLLNIKNSSNSKTISISTNDITDNRNIQLPDGNGTLVLNVNGHIPDSTGTITVPVGLGTVTSVTSINSDISITNPSTIPVLTLNSGLGPDQIVKRDGSGNLNADTVTTIPNLTGDITSIGNNTTISAVNSDIGSFGDAGNSAIITINAKGQVTAATSIPIQITESQVTNLTSDLNSKVSSVSGTSNRITSTGSNSPIIDIASTYVGQTSITTLGLITSGIWNATPISNAFLINDSITINGTNVILGSSGSFTTSAVNEGTNLYYTNTRVIAAPLTGYISGPGLITSSDSVISAIEKLNGNISAIPTPTNYWTETGSDIENNNAGNVNINTPNLVTTIGDINSVGNSTLLIVDDSGKSIVLNTTAGVTAIGDFNLNGNNTVVTIDDVTSRILLTTGTTNISSATIGTQKFTISATNSVATNNSIILQPNITGGLNANLVLKQNNITASSTVTLNAPVTPGSFNIATTVNSITPNTTNGNVVLNFIGGDVLSASAGSNVLNLATVNTNTGSWGTVTSIPTFTVNGKGLITAVTNTSIQIAESQVTNLVTDLAGKQATIGFTPENVANKTATASSSTTTYPNWLGVENYVTSLGYGSVTSVSSANSDISVATGTTTPVLTLNSGIGANQIAKRDGSGNFNATTVTTNANLTGPITSIGNTTTINNINGITPTYYDPTSSIQTQINSKQSTLVSGTNIKTLYSTSILGSGDYSPNLVGDIISTGLTTTYNNIIPSTKGGAGSISGILKANGSGVVSQATAGTDYENPLTFSSPLSRSINTISIPASTTSVNGYLTSTDWTTFNNKQATLVLTTSGTSGAATLIGSTLNIPNYAPGTGTVTSVSVTTANGISGTVATSTTTPAITLSLGAITPTTVNGNTISTGTGTLTLGAGKTLTSNNTLILSGTDGSTLNIGTGGTLGTAAYTSTTNYVAVNGTTPLTANWNAGAFNISNTYTAATANTVFDGHILSDTTTASATNQMYSPALHFIGQGWKTTSTAASQAVEFRNYLVPVQGTTVINGNLTWDAQVAGGGYTTKMQLEQTSGNLTTSGSVWSTGFGTVSFGLNSGGSGIRAGFQYNGASGLIQFGGFQAGYFPTFVQANSECGRFALTTGDFLLGTTTDVASSRFTVVSTTQGTISNPVMTNTQMLAISTPATGLTVYNSTFNQIFLYNGTSWVFLSSIDGSFSGTGTATTAFTVTIGQTMSNTTYKVNITPTSLLGTTSYYVSAKTTTTFTVTYVTGLTGTLTFDWLINP